VMLRDGLAEEGAGNGVSALDISEILAQAALPSGRQLPVVR
jgi:hypothetical protein